MRIGCKGLSKECASSEILSVMADLHNDAMYDGLGKTSAAGHRKCMGNRP